MFLFLLFLSLSIYIKLRYLRIALLPKQEIELTSPQKNQKQDESLCLPLITNHANSSLTL